VRGGLGAHRPCWSSTEPTTTFIPQSDTIVFTGRGDTEVHLIAETRHVARSKLDTVMPMMIGWLRRQLTGQTGPE